MILECPVCNKKTYDYYPTGYDGYQPIDPACGECGNCGFSYMQQWNSSESHQAEYYRENYYKKGKSIINEIKNVKQNGDCDIPF